MYIVYIVRMYIAYIVRETVHALGTLANVDEANEASLRCSLYLE